MIILTKAVKYKIFFLLQHRINNDLLKVIFRYTFYKPITRVLMCNKIDKEEYDDIGDGYGSIENWNTSQITNMSRFNSEYTLSFNEKFNRNIGNWDVSNVKDMSNIFYGCEKFNQSLDNWMSKR